MATKKENIAPGAQVRVEVVKRPTNAAALKTLRRVLVKDATAADAKKKDKLFRRRSESVKRRGGRPWEHRPTMRHPFNGLIGESGTLKATASVLHDLASISRFVKVTVSK